MSKNTIKMDALSNLTKFGQIKNVVKDAVESWATSTGSREYLDRKSQIMSELSTSLTLMGIGLTSKVPKIRIAATAISIGLGAQNTYLLGKNEMYLIPTIESRYPGFLSGANRSMGGGGAGET